MKKMLLFGLTAGALFAISASVSYVLRRAPIPPAEHKADGDETPLAETDRPGIDVRGMPAAAGAEATSRVAVRTPYVPEAEVAVQLASSLRDRETALKQREAKLLSRENNLELVFKDIRTERAGVDDMRKQVAAELQAVEAQMTAVKQEREKQEQEKKNLEQRVADLESRILELQGLEQTNMKKMAETYGLMDPEKAAKILQEMVESGKTDSAVKILGLMSQRQAAKVFAELPQKLAGELIEKLKDFKPIKPQDRK
jgi:flagellar motility protein MotE (MotC chaperone)